MSPQTLALYIAVSAAVTVSPGPDIMTVLVRSIAQGTRAGLIAALGFTTGLMVHTATAALGLGLLLVHSPTAYTVLRLAGVLYLLYLAVRIARSADAFLPTANAPRRPLRIVYAQSILMNVLNPKVTLFFLAFVPQFVETPTLAPFVLLGALFAAITLITFSLVALLAGTLSRGLRRNPHVAAPLRYATAGVFFLLAVRLALA